MHAVSKQRGVTLIEVLITLFVLAIGLLGMAGLQATALRATADSGNVGSATRLAYDMVDRVRLEVDPTIVNTFVTASASNQTASNSSACYGTSGCTGNARATAEVAEWQRLLAAGLPAGQGNVCRGTVAAGCTGTATDPVIVLITWQARDMQNQAANNGVITQRIVAVVG